MEDNIQEILDLSKSLKLQNANEAETRKKVIDKILAEALNWNENDISYEERVSEDGSITYADYIIRTANTAFIVEAKRIGEALLELPSKRRVKLSSGFVKGETGKAITQARDYCRKKSIAYAVVTNGDQWIIFPAIRVDQISFEKSHAVLFDSIETLLSENLEDFSNLLSRESVIDGSLEKELLGRTTDQIEVRRLKTFFKNKNAKPVNPIYPLIEEAVLSAFSDVNIESDIELLSRCYVQNAERIKFDKRISMHLNKSEPLFDSHPKRPLRRKENSAMDQEILKSHKRVRPLAILLLGSVGSGKTTFLNYTRNISAADYFSKKKSQEYPHWIEVDFRDYSRNQIPSSFIYSKIFDYLKTDDYFRDFNRSIRSAYKNDIQALRDGPMHLIAQDSEKFDEYVSNLIAEEFKKITPYVDKLVKHAASRVPIFLIADNVDQIEDEATESDIFAESIALSNKLGLNLIISMRESTYVKHRHTPTFDAFDFDPFQIEPPEIPAVLSRRFKVVNEMLKGKPGEFDAENGAHIKADDLSAFTELIQESVLGTEIGNRIEVLANHDIRLALRMTREFLARGYTDPAKALRVHKEKGQYVLPKQEAFKSILLGNQPVYSEEYSVIGNPFDSRLGKTKEQLMRLYILSMMVKVSSESSSEYVDTQYILSNMNSIGFSEQDVSSVLTDLCDLRFIHTSSHTKADSQSSFYASRLGGYLIRDLIVDMTFLEQVMMDTFIASNKIWNDLRKITDDIFSEKNIVQRLKLRISRARKFYTYMQELYQPYLEESITRALDSNWLGNPLEEMKPKLDARLTKAEASAQKNYGNKKQGKRRRRTRI